MTYSRKIKVWFANLLFSLEQYYFKINLSQDSSIHNSVSINKAFLKGHIKINRNSKILGGVYISGNVEIGKYTSINGPNVDIYSKINKVQIGNFCSIARNVSIQEFNHKIDSITTFLIFKNFFKESDSLDLSSKGDIIIGNDVWIGAHSIILSGVTIGNGAIIAANSVVTKNVPDFAIVGGNPANLIKFRFTDDLRKRLERIEWWNWEDEKIELNKNIFSGKLTLEKLEEIV